jgi:hypothetical protein
MTRENYVACEECGNEQVWNTIGWDRPRLIDAVTVAVRNFLPSKLVPLVSQFNSVRPHMPNRRRTWLREYGPQSG